MVQHPGSQQVKVSATIHLALDRFKPINLSFELAVAPVILHGVMNRFLILNLSSELFSCQGRKYSTLGIQQPLKRWCFTLFEIFLRLLTVVYVGIMTIMRQGKGFRHQRTSEVVCSPWVKSKADSEPERLSSYLR